MAALIVLTAVPTLKEARKLSGLLIQHKLAACVQISPSIESHYRWKGKLQKSREFQLWIKTQKAAYVKVERFIREHHSYEVPEILALSAVKGARPYLQWLERSVIP